MFSMDKPKHQFMMIGERGSGKTYSALLHALCAACQGDKVLWQSVTAPYAAQAGADITHLAKRLGMRITSVNSRSNSYRIAFPSGGQIHLRGEIRKPTITNYDLHIIDDCHERAEPPCADRVIRIYATNP